MKTRTFAITIGVLVILGICLSASMYVVEEGMQVVVTQFGKPVPDVNEAVFRVRIQFI